MALICEVLRRIIEALYRCTYIISVAITHRLVCSDGGIVEHLVLVWCLFFRWPESNFLSSGCCGLFIYLFILSFPHKRVVAVQCICSTAVCRRPGLFMVKVCYMYASSHVFGFTSPPS